LVWAGGECAAVATVLLGLRAGISAHANGVVWNAATDLLAVAVAVLTVFVVGAITAVLAPGSVRARQRSRVVSVTGAPEPTLRRDRPSGAVR
jgi:hypothetical protein